MSNYNYDSIQPPRVTVHLGRTINTGNFETVRIDLGAEDIKRPNETLGKARERLFNELAKELSSLEADVREAFDGD